MAKSKNKLSMSELVSNAKKVLKGKELNSNGKQLFDSVIRKAVKQRSAK